MAKKRKSIDVQKFGGVDELGSVKLDRDKSFGVKDNYEVNSVETQSDTKLEDDEGEGIPVIIRTFEFGANLEAFKDHRPTKQELFDAHKKGLEMHLWRDGMIYFDQVEPQITFNKKGTKYKIIIAALPARGQALLETPQTLSQIAHG